MVPSNTSPKESESHIAAKALIDLAQNLEKKGDLSGALEAYNLALDNLQEESELASEVRTSIAHLIRIAEREIDTAYQKHRKFPVLAILLILLFALIIVGFVWIIMTNAFSPIFGEISPTPTLKTTVDLLKSTITIAPTRKPSPLPTDPPTETLSPTQTSTATRMPTQIPQAIIEVQHANIRYGPGLIYPIFKSYPLGTNLNVLGRNQENTWIVVELSENEQGWIAISLVQIETDLSTLPVIEGPPTPIPPSVTATKKPKSKSSDKEKDDNTPIPKTPAYP